MDYKTVREQVVQDVIRNNPNPLPLDLLRAQFDAAFFEVNSQVSEAFAAKEGKRELLRAPKTLTFTTGDADIPTDVLKKYIRDGTFLVGATRYSYRRYPDFIRPTDARLGYWTNIGETFKAIVPVTRAALTGTATATFICSPAVPATESAVYAAPEDFIPDFIAAMTQFILGQPLDVASKTA